MVFDKPITCAQLSGRRRASECSVTMRLKKPSMARRPVPSLGVGCEWAEAASVRGLASHDGHQRCVCEDLHGGQEVDETRLAWVGELLQHCQPCHSLCHHRPHESQHCLGYNSTRIRT